MFRQARIRKNLRQGDVARLAGLAEEWYGRIERGHALGSLETFAMLRTVLAFDANQQLAALAEHPVPIAMSPRKPMTRASLVRGRHRAFGELIRAARLERRLACTTVATSIGTSAAFYGSVEAGRKLPAIGTFARLRQCLGFDANHLLDVLIDPPSPFAAFGRLLRGARQQRCMTADEVAEAVDCPVERYRSIESGAELPATILVARLHRLLEFDADKALCAMPLHPALPSETASCPYLEFGSMVRQARVKRRLTHADLIQSVGGTETYWTRMEAGLHVPSTKKLAALHSCLGFDANRLLRALHQERTTFQAFGQLLGDARQHCDLTPHQVASAAGCTVEHYQRVERGAELPPMMMLVRLHRALAFSADRALLAIPLDVPTRVSQVT